jgi:type VI secretion system protein VasJ
VADSATLAALGAAPIPGAAPAGASARYEPAFEQLAAEISKLESVEGRNSIRWQDVVRFSSELLSTKSKDLLVVSYLSLGAYHQEGYGGLDGGLTACRDMLTTHWDGLFPEKTRMAARQKALEWLSERVSVAVAEAGTPGLSDKDALSACVARVDEITKLISEKFTDGGPDLGLLSRTIQEKLDAVPSESAPSDSSSSSSSSDSSASSGDGGSSSSASTPSAPAMPEMESADSARQALGTLKEALLKAAGVIRQAAPTDPLGYTLQRDGLWIDVLAAPAATNNQLDLTGADAAYAAQAEEALAKGDYAAALGEAEGRLAGSPWWLDLNFISYRALEGLGRPYQAARKALGDATAALLRRAPVLLDLKFSDGIPLASEGTRVWILHELSALPPSAGPAGAGGLDAGMADARKLVSRKQFPEAAGLVLKELGRMPHRRDRFICRLNLARLCAEGGRAELALPQLTVLDEEARKFSLEEWEPALAAEVVRELWKLHKGSATPEKAEEPFARLCRLDPGAALGVDVKR